MLVKLPQVPPPVRQLASAYLDAKDEVISRGFASEIDWQYDALARAIDEPTFLREAAWVILSCGLSEKVVRSRFGSVTDAFAGFESAKDIWANRHACREQALSVFRFAPKIDAILTLVGYLSRVGFAHVCCCLEEQGIEFLLRFPYMGPATARHLAKNLGSAVAKPDRHLIRIASSLGFPSAAELCDTLAAAVGDPVPVVDVVLWRYCTFGPALVARLCSAVHGEAPPTM